MFGTALILSFVFGRIIAILQLTGKSIFTLKTTCFMYNYLTRRPLVLIYSFYGAAFSQSMHKELRVAYSKY